jgi:uncharacterized glyoxalase superfamily protein PhnB
MKFKPIIPIIWTLELDATIQFYCHVLEFECIERNEGWNWAILKQNECELMVANPSYNSFKSAIFTGSFYINVDDVDQLWYKLKDITKICYEIQTFEWGMREFSIYDNNGYQLQFGQDMTQFL